jgi:hypothetical protein
VFFHDSNNGWIVGSFGTLLHTTNGGATWTTVDPGTSDSFSSIHFINSQHGWIAGGNNDDATILHTSDGGNTWVAEDPGTTNFLYDIFLTDASHGWAGGIHGDIVSTIQTGNTPPDQPFNPIPADGATEVNLNPTLSVMVTDPNTDTMTVSFYDASDQSLIGMDSDVESGERAYIIWNGLSGGTTYSWYAIADDGEDSTQSSTWMFTTVGGVNQPPVKPTIIGKLNGRPGVEYFYRFVTTDPEGGDVYFYVDWGDGTIAEWIGPYDSGEEEILCHIWEQRGVYDLRVKAKDTSGLESEWANLEVEMPNTYSYYPGWNWLQTHFPWFAWLLNRIGEYL